MERLRKLMEDNQPHVCVVGASSMDCNFIRELVLQTVFKMVEDSHRVLAGGCREELAG